MLLSPQALLLLDRTDIEEGANNVIPQNLAGSLPDIRKGQPFAIEEWEHLGPQVLSLRAARIEPTPAAHQSNNVGRTLAALSVGAAVHLPKLLVASAGMPPLRHKLLKQDQERSTKRSSRALVIRNRHRGEQVHARGSGGGLHR